MVEKIYGEQKNSSIKIFEPSEELASENWDGYIVKDKIVLSGPNTIKLKKAPQSRRKIDIESKKPIAGKTARYWAEAAIVSSRDYLLPVITKESFDANLRDADGYLEEYILEQIEWEMIKSKDIFILPENFTKSDSSPRGFELPEYFKPAPPSYGDMGMGGMGGMGGMPDLGNIGDMLKQSDTKETSESEPGMDDVEEIDAIKNAVDAEIIKDKEE